MNLEERIEKEQENNDRLAREIEDLRAQAALLLSSAEALPHRERGNATRRALREIDTILKGPVGERRRQKKESDDRLEALKRDWQEQASTGKDQAPAASEFETEGAMANPPDGSRPFQEFPKKAIELTKKAGKKYPKGFDGLQAKNVDMSGYFAQVDLTKKQLECYSLRNEYDLPLAEVAGRLSINRKTAYEHIHEAEKKINLQFGKRRDQFGRIKKAPIAD